MDFNITMDDLPLVERDRVLALYAACKRIREASACYGGQQEAIRDAAALCGISPVTMRRWYDIWRNSDDNPLSLVDRRYRKIQARSRVTLSKFLAYWHGLCTRCQRNGGIPTARQLLLKTWTERRDTIPGYEDWPGWPRVPSGWSLRNLQRLAPQSLETVALKQGIRAAAPQLAQVLATREGLWLGSHFLFDDVWLDLMVLSGRDKGQPLQLGVLEYLTGKRVAWGQKIRRRDEETGKMIHLNQRDMRSILALWGATVGYSPKGTTLVVENGTAAISKELEDLLYHASGGLIKVDRSGIGGVRQTLKQGHGGRGVGNPRHKAALESYHNLQHNRISHLPGATGHDRTPPETLHGLVRAEEQLIKAMDKLPADKAGQLKHYMLTMDELSRELTKIVSDINTRTDHRLEGWERCGFMVEELRLSASASWTPSSEVEPSMAAQIIRTACETGADLVRRRRMSPSEAWACEEAKPGNRLIKLPPWCICQILGTDMGRPIKVASAYIRMRDKTIRDEDLIYEARVATPDGAVRVLAHGTYQGYVNPYDDNQLFVCGQDGRVIGTASLVQRVCTADTHAVEQAMGKAAGYREQQLEYARIIGANTEADIVRKREHNRRLMEGKPVTAAEYAQAYSLTPTPADKRTVTRAATAAAESMPDISLIPASGSNDDELPHDLPDVRFL